jgi:pSer/pThr/pTyr-binding forkhead associated (FHA) protein
MHPTQSLPVQSWTFESESVIRIGRANDNDVVIYSAVVSRHHVELWKEPYGWEIINFGANGTYVNGEPIVQVAVKDGTILRLGTSGPKLQVTISEDEQGKATVKTPDGKLGKRSPAAKIDARPDEDTIITRRQSTIEEKMGGEDDVTMFDFE